MQTSEKINTSSQSNHEKTAEREHTPTPSLREKLLSAYETPWDYKGDYVVTLPRDTVLIEVNSKEITYADTDTSEFFGGLSARASKLLEGSETSKPEDAVRRGYGKLEYSTTLPAVDHDMRIRSIGESSPNLTMLYDGKNIDIDGETKIPSAILVHDEMSPEQIKELRDRLPAGVPLLDAKTNRLLDKTGAAEREKAQHDSRIKRDLGDFAIHNFGELYGAEALGFEWVAGNSQQRRFNREREDFWNRTIHVVNVGSPEYDTMRSHVSPEAAEEFANRYGKKEEEPLSKSAPEPQPVVKPRTYRESVSKEQAEMDAYEENRARGVDKAVNTILEEAKERYGVSNLSSLDDNQLRKVERGVQSKLHPDRGYENGGDQSAFQEAGVLMNRYRTVKDAMEEEEKASTSQPSPSPESPPESEKEEATSEAETPVETPEKNPGTDEAS